MRSYVILKAIQKTVNVNLGWVHHVTRDSTYYLKCVSSPAKHKKFKTCWFDKIYALEYTGEIPNNAPATKSLLKFTYKFFNTH